MKKIFFVLLSFTSPVWLVAQIQHVEPLNWFIGMKNKNLQLLVNGNDVGACMPVIHYPGVTIKKISPGDSKNYLFIDLYIDPNTKPGIMPIRFIRSGKTIYTYNYSLLTRKQAAADFKGFNSSDVIYLIVPDRFANGDYNNDSVAGMREIRVDRSFEGARHGGDIRGIIDHLDYIHDMGFTAVWPTPLLENDMAVYSYHGYSITNHYKVDPRFGNLDDYKELSAKLKKKGMKLIFDGVINHIGTNYWWMHDLPFKNWINFPDSMQRTNHRRTVNEDLYASQYDKDLMTKGWFDKTMADMNGLNPFLANYLIQNSIWWIETLQLGGIRQDTYCYSDKTFSKNWSCSIMNEYPNFSLVGEEWSLNPLITSYWQKGKLNRDGYTSCLTTIMDFPLQSALIGALAETDSTRYSNGLTGLYEELANDFVYADPNNIMVMCDNHDMDRIYMQLNQNLNLTKMAMAYLLTIRGIPQIFYGTEILLDNTGHHKNDGLIRADFPGGWKGDPVNAFAGQGLTPDQSDMKNYLSKLLIWRKNNPVISGGATLHFAPYHGLYVYFRYNKEKTIMVILNKNTRPTIIETKRFSEILKSKTAGKNIMTNERVSINQPFTVAPESSTILDIQ
jgi:neopullulanase